MFPSTYAEGHAVHGMATHLPLNEFFHGHPLGQEGIKLVKLDIMSNFGSSSIPRISSRITTNGSLYEA